MLNPYRIVADMSHMASIFVYLFVVLFKGNAAGVSLRAHQLYLIVFLSRYVDLLLVFYSWYNSVMKLFYLFATATIVFTLFKVEPAKSTYSARQDNMHHWRFVLLALLISGFIHILGRGVVHITGDEFEVHFENWNLFESLWTFSICLEPMAMLPQLWIFYNNRILITEIQLAIFLKGIYRLLYIANWIYRSNHELNYRHHFVVYIAGVVQVVTYTDFFLFNLK